MKLTKTNVTILFLTISILLISVISFAQENTDWSQFRGPNGSGLSETTNLPLEFGPNKNVVWKRDLPTGYSSPVLTGDYIFLTADQDGKLLTICLNRNNGETVWQKIAPRDRAQKIDNRNNPASPSAVTDGQNVYVFFPDYGMLGYDIKGNELWRYPLGPFNNIYGMGASPILADDKVVLVIDQNIGSYIIAFNKKDGKVAWKKDRPEAKSGHCTPIVYKAKNGETEILVPGSFLLIAYSPKTGERIWWSGGLSFEMKSTPVIQDGVLFINGYASLLNQPENQVTIPAFEQALKDFDKNNNKQLTQEELPKERVYRWFSLADINQDSSLHSEEWSFFEAALASLNGMLAIRLGGRGDVTKSNAVWQYRRSVPQLPSPLIYKNILYMLADNGIVTSFNPKNGEVIQKGKVKGAGRQFYASLIAADNKIFITSLDGKISVIQPGGSLDVIASTDLQDGCYATPAIADGKIYVRTLKTLYCFGKMEE